MTSTVLNHMLWNKFHSISWFHKFDIFITSTLVKINYLIPTLKFNFNYKLILNLLAKICKKYYVSPIEFWYNIQCSLFKAICTQSLVVLVVIPISFQLTHIYHFSQHLCCFMLIISWSERVSRFKGLRHSNLGTKTCILILH